MEEQVKSVGQFQLGDCIGKGAFGAVYRGLNSETGEVVAIKQVKMANIPKSEITMIMLEIDLLKKLNHANIVKYLGFVKTRDYLYIILEFCENGSLQTTMKKFGKISETLVALYIYQVLKGLCYLHEEGVVHRDIKGANILTTKDGMVKLGDFGVATKLTDAIGSDAEEGMVVGSPYWMAPEVVEMSAPTTASDIWSVGCTIIELIQGEPPYFSSTPMAALFKIVQDDHPPFPDGASSLLVDFLLQCFQKDPNLRTSAKKLLKHPWLHAARSKMDTLSAEKAHNLAGNDDDSDTKSKSERSEADLFERSSSASGSVKSRPINAEDYVENDGDFDGDLDIDIDFIEQKLKKSGMVVMGGDSTDKSESDFPDMDDNDDDPFSAIAYENDPSKDLKAKLSSEIMELIKKISVEEKSDSLLNIFSRLCTIFKGNKDLCSDLIKYRGVIPILTVLESRDVSDEVMTSLLEMLNAACSSNAELLENICFLGGVPRVLQLAESKVSSNVRKESSVFIKCLIQTNDLTRRVFVSCRGLGVLMSLIKLKYTEDRSVVWSAVDGILAILNLQGSAPRNDFCRILAEGEGLLNYVDVFRQVMYDKTTGAEEVIAKMLETLNIFSRSDAYLKEALSQRFIVKPLVYEYTHLSMPNQLLLLKCLKNLSVSTTFLDSMQKIGAGPTIVKLLSYSDGQYLKEIRNQAIYILFNFCRLNKARQDIAAMSGIVPYLMDIIKANNPLKQFALPILCDMAHGSKVCREALWKNNGLQFFLFLLNDANNLYWQVNALEAISAWQSEDSQKVEKTLVEADSVKKLISSFVSTKASLVGQFIVPFQKILASSPALCCAVSRMDFMDKLLSRLSLDNVGVRLNLLKILLSIIRAQPKPKQFALTFKVEPIVQNLCTSASSVLAREMAATILQECSQAESPKRETPSMPGVEIEAR